MACLTLPDLGVLQAEEAGEGTGGGAGGEAGGDDGEVGATAPRSLLAPGCIVAFCCLSPAGGQCTAMPPFQHWLYPCLLRLQDDDVSGHGTAGAIAASTTASTAADRQHGSRMHALLAGAVDSLVLAIGCPSQPAVFICLTDLVHGSLLAWLPACLWVQDDGDDDGGEEDEYEAEVSSHSTAQHAWASAPSGPAWPGIASAGLAVLCYGGCWCQAAPVWRWPPACPPACPPTHRPTLSCAHPPTLLHARLPAGRGGGGGAEVPGHRRAAEGSAV